MKPLFLTIHLLLLFLPILSAQNYVPSEERQFRALTGDIYCLNFFINTSEGTWTDTEINRSLRAFEDSQKWILEASGRYNVELNFINDFIDTKKEVITINSVKDVADRGQVLKLVMEYMGFDNYREYFEFYGLDLNKNKVRVLFFVKGISRNYVCDFDGSYSEADSSINSAILYYKNRVGIPLRHEAISHEILHLFGAWDLYDTKLSEKTSKRAKMLSRKSIMRCPNCPGSEVDDLTAWLIGWHRDYKEIYRNSTPTYKRGTAIRDGNLI